MKQGVTSGAYGETSGKNEYEVVLEIGLKLRDILTSKGYTVVMTRETNEVSISNVQRAQIATEANADIFVRIHCNGVDDTTVAGVMCYGPSGANPYLSVRSCAIFSGTASVLPQDRDRWIICIRMT